MCGAVQYGQPLALPGVSVQEGAFRRRQYTRNEGDWTNNTIYSMIFESYTGSSRRKKS